MIQTNREDHADAELHHLDFPDRRWASHHLRFGMDEQAAVSRYENKAVPFKTVGNRQCLTRLQIMQEPWLGEFVESFPKCFEFDVVNDVFWFDRDGGKP